jgi:release factor glutamine methyltransferase
MSNKTIYNDLLGRIASSWEGLSDKPEETPEGTLHALWLLATGIHMTVEQAGLLELPNLSDAEIFKLNLLIDNRIAGIPLAHLTKRQNFMGLQMIAGPEALIARKETEILARAAHEKLKTLVQERDSVKVIDICTGSGNIALALAYYEQSCRVFGADISAKAIDLAQINAHYLGLADRVDFRIGDLLIPFKSKEFLGQVDIITCNPPYISSRNVENLPREISKHEPHAAFDGGPFGISIILRVIQEAVKFLKPNSWLCLEVGLNQGDLIASRLERLNHYKDIKKYLDSEGNVRALLAQT